MWPFSRKQSLLGSGLLRGATDWHCHILPGVDDGVRTMEEALEVLAWYAEAGFRDVMEDVPNTPAFLRERFDELKAAYRGPVALHLAAEHMLDNLFDERLAAGELLPMGESLLVETSFFNPPMDLRGILGRIREHGWQPLLAHPERYLYMDENDYRDIHASGVAFQLNLPTLTGLYGPEARRRARFLLREGFYDRSGTDLHRLKPIRSAVSDRVLPSDTVLRLKQLMG